MSDIGNTIAFVPIQRVMLRLRAGVSGFETEPELIAGDPIAISVRVISELKVAPQHLLAIQVRDQGMEPMLFEDDWIVIDTSDTVRRSREVYAVNWNGEACIVQLLERGGQWYLSYVNQAFKPINARSGQLNVVGRFVYQAGRIVTGRL
jgi:SOS-response transcriptional repressor LexA